MEIQTKPEPVVHLTPKEQAWLAKHKSIQIGYDGTLPPYSFINDSGQFDGMAVDIINVLSKRLGINFKVYPNVSWNSLYKAAAAHKVDIIATMVDSPERRIWFNFTEPYLTKSLVIMTRQDDKTIHQRKDLKKKTVALVKGYKYGEIVQKEFPSIKPYPVNSMLEGLDAVAFGKADAAITFMATTKYLQKTNFKENLKFAAFYDRNSANESIAVRKDWPILTSILQKGLNSLSAEETQAIFDKWVPPN